MGRRRPAPVNLDFIKATDHAKKNWKKLDSEQKAAAVVWAAQHLEKRLKTVYKDEFGAGVLGIGHGARETQEGLEDRTFECDPVLVVIVVEDFAKSYRAATKRKGFPTHVQVTVPIEPKKEDRPEEGPDDWFTFHEPAEPKKKDKKKKKKKKKDKKKSKQKDKKKPLRQRLALGIPIDVTSYMKPKAHAAVQDQRLLVTGEAGLSGGTACALVKIRNQKTPYLLSCHHVLWKSKGRPGATPDKTAKVYSATKNSGAKDVDKVDFLGKPWPKGPSLAKNRIDVAMLVLNDAGMATVTPRSYWRVKFAGFLSSAQQWATFAKPMKRGFRLFPWGTGNAESVLKLKYVKAHPNEPIDYIGAVIKIREVFVFTCDDAPQPGYSGSPVAYKTSKGWALIGMHIAGEGKQSFVLPAYLFMAPNRVTKSGLVLA